MEDTPLGQPMQSSESLDVTDAAVPVSSYALAPKVYPIENLEVHREGDRASGVMPVSIRSVPFSRRRAVIVSLAITLLVIILTAILSVLFIASNGREVRNGSQQSSLPTQDVSFGDRTDIVPEELQGESNALLVNGDVITRGDLKVVSADFVTALEALPLTANQTVRLPNASGVVCLDTNNCNFATQNQLTQSGGVASLNGLVGGLTIQGSPNRIMAATSSGAITISTPQDLDANANVQFGNLTLSALRTGPLRVANGALTFGTINLGTTDDITGTLIVANGGTGSTSLTANGVLVGNGADAVHSAVAAVAGQCLVSTVGVPAFQACPGSGGVTSLNALSGALTLQGTTNRIIVSQGGSTITISAPQDIATSSSPTFAGLTSPTLQSASSLTLTSNAGSDVTLTSAHDIHVNPAVGRMLETTGYLHVSNNSIDVDAVAAIGNSNSIVPGGATDSRYTVLATTTFNVDCATGCAGVYGAAELGSGTNPTLLSGLRGVVKVGDTRSLTNGAGLYVDSNILGTGASLVNNYGVYVSNQSVGTNDYGVYIQGADTLALFVDAGDTRLDGSLAVNGGSITSSGALAITPGGALTVGTTGQTVTLQGSSTTITSTGAGNDISLTAADQIILDAGTTIHATDDFDIDGHLGIGASASPISIAVVSVSETFTSADNCGGFGCYGILSFVTADNTAGVNDGVTGVYSRVLTAAAASPYTLDVASSFTASNPTAGSNSTIVSNYGLYVETMTAGTTDVGVYIQGADTYALHVDAGATRLDGTLELQTLGTTNTATYLCRNSSSQLAACNSTGSGAAFLQGGNNFGANATLGTTGVGQTLSFITANTTRLTLDTSGNASLTGNLTVDGASGISLSQDTTPITFGSGGAKPWTLGPRDANNFFGLTYQGTEMFAFSNDGKLGVGNNGNPDARLEIRGDLSKDAWGLNGIQIQVDSATYTDLTSVGTATNAIFNSFGRPTLAANSAVTTTNAATMYIQNAPAAGANQTITNAYSLWVDDGVVRLDGNVGINNATAPNRLSLNTLTTADSNAQLAVSTGALGSKGMVVQGVASQSADLFQAQSSAGVVLASISAAGNLTVQNATVNGHIITANSSGSTTVTQGAAADCSGTASTSISGNDTAGTVTINTSTGSCSPGVLATVTFANAYSAAPRVILTPANANGATLQYYNGTTNTSTYTIDTGTAATTSTTYIYNYHVIQ